MLDQGIRLQLLIGPTVPLPAPYPVMSAFVSLDVTNRDRERDGFQMTFTLGKNTPLGYGLLQSGIFKPGNRVIIGVVINVLPQVLIDGIITHHQVMPSNQAGESRLIVTGEDITLKLDLEEKSETFPNQSDSVIAMRLLAEYADLGLVPQVTPTTDFPIEIDRVPNQQGTDLAYLRQLAQRNGFVFYVEPTAVPGLNTAYWGLENRLGLPQPPLSLNMGSETNVDNPINFTHNALGPAAPMITIVEPNSRMPITIPLPTGLQPPLARQPSVPLRRTIDRSSASLSPTQAAQRILAATGQTADAVTASGEVDAVRYGRALRSRRLVSVRGVGDDFGGFYYVKEVTHQISVGQYRQRFTLTREGTGALTPIVPPGI
ncbi:MAG: hypothetical protein R6X32_20500 [Chloroflexota bacterium]|jgi:hypothetical protein